MTYLYIYLCILLDWLDFFYFFRFFIWSFILLREIRKGKGGLERERNKKSEEESETREADFFFFVGGEIRRLGRKEEKEKGDQSFGRHISLRVGKTIRARMIK